VQNTEEAAETGQQIPRFCPRQAHTSCCCRVAQAGPLRGTPPPPEAVRCLAAEGAPEEGAHQESTHHGTCIRDTKDRIKLAQETSIQDKNNSLKACW